jgi:hypothetical protein
LSIGAPPVFVGGDHDSRTPVANAIVVKDRGADGAVGRAAAAATVTGWGTVVVTALGAAVVVVI